MDETLLAERRRQMIESQIRMRGVRDPRVLAAMERVPRHRFVRDEDVPMAYGDHPIPVGFGQTISQPYIVAYMTEQLALPEDARVLEVGTGSGYQTAVLAELAREVYTMEIVPELAEQSARLLDTLGYHNVHARFGDGYVGWKEVAPFDAIIVTAAPDHLPPPLLEQLVIGGRIAVPVGRGSQDLIVYSKTADGVEEQSRLPVRFVPLTRSH
jgi:protein-L-isoaspartate(D-aspartate) O-methyltransferase